MPVAINLTLGKRIGLLVVLGLSLLICLFGFLTLRGLQESSNRALDEWLMAAQLSARHVDNFLSMHLASLTEAVGGEIGDPRNADGPTRARICDRLMHRWSGITFHLVLVTDEAGRVLWMESDPSHPLAPDDFDNTPTALAAVRSGKGVVSDALRDKSGRVLLSLTVPFRGPDGAIAGSLSEVLDLSNHVLDSFVQPVSLGNTGYAQIVDRNGVVLASSNPSGLFQKSDHTDQFAALIDARRPTVSGCHSCHQSAGESQVRPDVLAFAPLSAAPWGIALRQSEDEAFGPTRDLERSLFLAGIVSILVAVVIVWLMSKSVVWPIKALTVAARRIATGDLETSIDRGGPAEVGELAAAFGEMRTKLKATLDKLELANANLETRVERRTRQLAALLDVSKLLSSTLDMRTLLDSVVARVGDVLELADAGTVSLYSERTERIEVSGSWGYDEGVKMISLARGEGLAGLAFERGKSVQLNGTDIVMERRATLSAEDRAWLLQATRRLGTAQSALAVPLIVKGKPIGAMILEHYRDSRIFSPADVAIAEALADQVALAVENARLYEEVREEERMRGELLEKTISAQEEERKRIARELHDETCQSLAALAIRLEEAEENLPETAVDARSELGLLKIQASSILREVRTIAYNLRPSVLDDLGLIMAIDWYAREQVARRGLDVKLDMDGFDRKLPPALETVLFRIAQESLNNVIKHSGASRVVVRLQGQNGTVALEVEDDGLGFELDRVLRPRGQHATLGLQGMIERARLSGGVLKVASAVGQGTVIRVELPIQRGQENWHEEDHSAAGRRS